MPALELLTNDEMGRADRLAMASGVPSLTLMENAGQAVAEQAGAMVEPGARICVLAGPGNNGGDGFWAARLLQRAGFDVEIALLGDRDRLTGDAAEMSQRWTGTVGELATGCWQDADLVVDAIFGAGLTRELSGAVAAVAKELNDSGAKVLAVDVPSGVNGSTGAADVNAISAAATVTFFRRKPGHLLEPGRALCGEIIVADIGIPVDVLGEIGPQASANAPGLWLPAMPWPANSGHKYDRGHAVVVSGPPHATGAARLGAEAALRVGAGLVTMASPPEAVAINAAHLTAVMLKPCDGAAELAGLLMDVRKNAVLIGPGAGIDRETCLMAQAALASKAAVVLDADALTAFEKKPDELFDAISDRDGPDRKVVLTPHSGEFSRLFSDVQGEASKLDRARAAALASGAVVVLKGPDTVVAAPDGRACINENAPAWLATAGAGDVLAGMVAGLMAQQMPTFEAACAAVWMHGECANQFGIGLIAEDLSPMLPCVLSDLAEETK